MYYQKTGSNKYSAEHKVGMLSVACESVVSAHESDRV